MMVVKERLDLNTYLRENNIEEPLKIKYKKQKGKWIISKVNYDVRFMYDSGAAQALYDFSKKPFNFY